MRDVMYSVPDMPDVRKVIITSGVIDGTEEAIIHRTKNIGIA